MPEGGVVEGGVVRGGRSRAAGGEWYQRETRTAQFARGARASLARESGRRLSQTDLGTRVSRERYYTSIAVHV